ncbi:MAG: atpF [Parcubacteria group bacterium]|jgi:F-type H+-transporting ATPase subunit b|nr:atpF [Parcubacteria group bacterium]
MAALFAAFGLQLPLLIAQLVNFAILMIALTYLLYKPVMKTIEARKQKVAQGVLDAEEATKKLSTADAEATVTVQQAEKEAEGIVASAREEAGSEKMRIVKEADARAASIAADADARAKETAAKSLRESEKEIARLAILAAEKAMRT